MLKSAKIISGLGCHGNCHMTWCRLLQCRSSRLLSQSPTIRRKNEVDIQMLSEPIYKQIFKQEPIDYTKKASSLQALLKKIENHLTTHELWGRETSTLPDVDFKLPELLGKSIEEHFQILGKQQVEEYQKLLKVICNCNVPTKPKTWEFREGWVKYSASGEATPVDYPEENVYVFDVEVLVPEGQYPTMATAVSDKHWYSWCSPYLIKDKFRVAGRINQGDLVPLESRPGPRKEVPKIPRIVIGHNVGFDRSFVKEQYCIQKSGLRFMDTMSLHIAVCGLTNFQRILYQAARKNSNRKEVREWEERSQKFSHIPGDDWKEISTLNNLADVYKLHVGGKDLDKSTRDIFMKGKMGDIREQFQELMTYCAGDTEATLEVLKVVYPQFCKRFPHPVTLAGMFEMGTGYLPINKNWQRYVQQSNETYDECMRESKALLINLANNACGYIHGGRYSNDPWLWELDWKVRPFKLNKEKRKPPPPKDNETAQDRVKRVYDLLERLPKRMWHMVGYPEWYRELCPKPADEDWAPGPSNITSRKRVTPMLMRLTWEGYPLCWSDEHGWGYLVPGRTDNLEPKLDDEDDDGPKFPAISVHQFCGINIDEEMARTMSHTEYEEYMNRRLGVGDGLDWEEKSKHWEAAGVKKKRFPPKGKLKGHPTHKGDGPYDEVDFPGCWFYKLPHKDGLGKRVGSPLSKDYLKRVEDGTLRSWGGGIADQVLKLGINCSYWTNAMKRIAGQLAVWFREEELPETITSDEEYAADEMYGAIVPRIAVSGTITRRAVEATWMTASNAYEDRIGSELKAMVQVPPGYHFVGADVDSQELWIATLLGDSNFAKIHGATAAGWMMLQGKKADKTDLHSKVAETVGISRDNAKVFNYSRIYGAGQNLAERTLLQNNHRLTEQEAKQKAKLMYETTKGKRGKGGIWQGGSESAMFNKLEEIAKSDNPRTPVLGCKISKTLEPDKVNEDFMTSRINWVVQSSAVDYLHLMLVCMRWLFDKYNIDGRFSISIHDEVRYLVKSEDRYRAALALQITNLLTRSLFAYKLGMKDLPQSVAFFSQVDLDVCLRKEVNMECVTPSNPHGLQRGYGIAPGEALSVYKILEKTGGRLDKVEVIGMEELQDCKQEKITAG